MIVLESAWLPKFGADVLWLFMYIATPLCFTGACLEVSQSD